MRGSLIPLERVAGAAGIIPAHAGLTKEREEVGNASRDHPRACGAHALSSTIIQVETGSSPRMRGSLLSIVSPPFVKGIIPAHAGLTAALPEWVDDGWDHPRACGAHHSNSVRDNGKRGSSPRMRGSQQKQDGGNNGIGIIPAHAGLTRSPCSGGR